VKTAITGTTNANDLLKLKANPGNFDDEDNSNSDGSDDDVSDNEMKVERRKTSTAAGSSSDKYVPPKITSMPYEDDESSAQKQRERARKRVINSALIDEWKEEFLDTPVEIMGSSRAQQQLSREMKERERYEEENFVRLPMTKEERHRQKRLSTMGALGEEITSFRGSLGSGGNSNKRKRTGKGKKGGGGKRRKFH
jgi:U3 small nucleolar ribonucleoprotein protein LCP5